jgi:hypothetical protein
VCLCIWAISSFLSHRSQQWKKALFASANRYKLSEHLMLVTNLLLLENVVKGQTMGVFLLGEKQNYFYWWKLRGMNREKRFSEMYENTFHWKRVCTDVCKSIWVTKTKKRSQFHENLWIALIMFRTARWVDLGTAVREIKFRNNGSSLVNFNSSCWRFFLPEKLAIFEEKRVWNGKWNALKSLRPLFMMRKRLHSRFKLLLRCECE